MGHVVIRELSVSTQGACWPWQMGKISPSHRKPVKLLVRSLRRLPSEAGGPVLPKEDICRYRLRLDIQPCKIWTYSIATSLHEQPVPPKLSASIKPAHPQVLCLPRILWNQVRTADGVPKDDAAPHVWRTVLFCRCLVFRLFSRLTNVPSNNNIPSKTGWEAHILKKHAKPCCPE